MFVLRQLYFGQLDMELHSCNFDEAHTKENMNPLEVQEDVANRGFSLLPPLHEDRFLCSFAHIFAGGYAAGYYSYIWAEVLSADAFDAFEERGLHSTDIQEIGRRFRDTVLAK